MRAPDSPGGLLDLLVRLPDGRTAQLPAAIAVSAPMATAQASPSLSKPTNDAAAFRTFDLYADRVTRYNVTDHLGYVDIYPSSLNSNALLVTRSVTDTMALFKSMAYDGIDWLPGFPVVCGVQDHPAAIRHIHRYADHGEGRVQRDQ